MFSIGRKNRQDASLLSRRLASAEITRKSRGYFGVLSITEIFQQLSEVSPVLEKRFWFPKWRDKGLYSLPNSLLTGRLCGTS